MAVTINVNNLSLCHQGSGGVSTATLPDVCKTPTPGGPVPMPYPNIAFSRDLARGTRTITADGGHMCANYGSRFSRSTGDAPGTLGGVKSGTVGAEATWITYSFDVRLEGKGACRLTDKMFHNRANTVNLAGEAQKALTAFMDKICPIICEVVERIKKSEKPPSGKSTWTQYIQEETMKRYGDDLARMGIKMEKTVIVAAAKGAAKKWGRKAITTFGKKLGQKAVIAWIPVVGQIAAGVLTAVDVVMTVRDVAQVAGQVVDMMRVRPDFTISAGGETLVGDIKLPGDDWGPGQKEAYDAINGSETPVLDAKTCKC